MKYGMFLLSRQAARGLRWALLILLLVGAACTLPALPFSATATRTNPASSPTPVLSPTPAKPYPVALLEVWPQAGSTLAFRQDITFYFNQPMQAATVEQALSFSPAVAGKMEWLDESTLKFTPDEAFPFATDLKITLANNILSKNNQTMTDAVELSYRTADAPAVSEQLPLPGALNVDPSLPLVVSFNQPIIPLVENDPAALPAAFALEPEAAGRGEWINSSTYVFYPSPPLKGGSSYNIHLRSDLAAAAGGADWHFSTAMPEVLSVFPNAEAGLLALDGTIKLRFNQPMERQSVEQALTLSAADQQAVAGTYTWDDDGTEVTYQPGALLARDTTYVLNLSTAARAANGDYLPRAYSYPYQTVSSLALSSTQPGEGELLSSNGSYSYITLKYNVPLSQQQKLEPLVSFDPPAGDVSVYINDNNNLMVMALLKPNSSYRLRVSTDLKDRWGGNLTVSPDMQFKTDMAKPSVKVPMLQFTRTLFLHPQDSEVTALVNNISSLVVRSQAMDLKDFIDLEQDERALRSYAFSGQQSWLLHFDKNSQGESSPIQLSTGSTPLKPGLYYYRLASKEVTAAGGNDVYFLASVSHIQLTLKRSLKEMLVWAVDLDNNQPVVQKALLLYDQSGTAVARCTTDIKGTCVFDLPTPVDRYDIRYYAVMGQPGSDDFSLALDSWSMGTSGYNFGLNNQIESGLPYVYLYTDRPIYRPGQTVYFRLAARRPDNGRYLPADMQQLTVKVMGEYSELSGQSPLVANVPLTLSSFGTAEGSFKLAEDAPVGFYRFEFDKDVDSNYVSFMVAAYRKPQVDLNLSVPFADVKMGENLQSNLDAQYYFGAAAARLPVSWTLYARPNGLYLPQGYRAGKSDSSWYDSSAWLSSLYGEGGSLGMVVTGGSGMTDISGAMKINIKADALNNLDAEMPYELTLEATLDDGSSQTVSARASLNIHPADIYIGVQQEGWSGQVNRELGFMLQTVNWQSTPVGGKKVSASLQKVDWQEREPQEGSFLPLSPIPMFTPVSTVDVITDDAGQARISFTPQEAGNYRLELRGEGAVSDLWVWVGGEGAPRWVSLPNQRLDISSDAAGYESGQEAHIFIPNPLGTQTLALITVERGKVMQTQVVSITESSYDYVLPVTDDLAPNVYVSVTLLGQNAAQQPDFRQGYLEVKVTPRAETLNVAFVAQPQKTAPGSETLLALQVKDANGQPVNGQFSLSLVDKAVLALADPNAPDIVTAFYGENPLGVFTSLSLAGYANRAAQSFGGGGRGGGGGEAPYVRRNFADTAFWKGDIQTDAQGMAQVQVKLPDNLTTWVAQVRGLTEDTRVGEAKLEIETSKPLMVQPVTPRFAVVGDHLQLGAVVFNNTSAPLEATVNLTSDGFKADENSSLTQKVTVNPLSQARVNWLGTVQDSPSLNLVFSASAGDLVDQTLPEEGALPVLRYETPQTFATLGVLSEAGEVQQLIQAPRSFKPDGGELHIELTPSLSTALLSGLADLQENPFENNEAMASMLLPYLAADSAGVLDSPDMQAQKDMIQAAIRQKVNRLVLNQTEDGGWGWQAGGRSQPFLSAYVLLSLSRARAAGYEVPDQILQNGQVYLQNQIMLWPDVPRPSDYNRRVWMQYALQESGVAADFSGITLADWMMSYQSADQLSPWAKALLALGLNKAQPHNPQAAEMINDLVARASRLASGLYWTEASPDYDNLSSPNLNTALVLHALSQFTVDTKILNEGAYYLMLHRRASGGWYSSYENAWVLTTLSEVMKLNNDGQTSYGFSATLDNQLVAGRQTGSNNQSMVEKNIDLEQLNPNGANILSISRQAGAGSLFYRVHLKINQPVQSVLPLQKGLTLTRRYELGGADCAAYPCPVVDTVNLQQIKSPLTVRLSLSVPHDMDYIMVEDTIPAGVDIVNRLLKTTQQGGGVQPSVTARDIFEQGWNNWYFGEPQIGDRTVRWMVEKLPAGTYELTYQVMPQLTGSFNAIPAHAWQIYYPEVEASSSGAVLKIED